MAIITYATRCPSCRFKVEADISVELEQQGSAETEHMPEHWDLYTYLHCVCGYEFEMHEDQAVVKAARRYYGT